MAHGEADVERLNTAIDALSEGADTVNGSIVYAVQLLDGSIEASNEHLAAVKGSREELEGIAGRLDGWLTEFREFFGETTTLILASESKVLEEQSSSHASMKEAQEEFQRKALKESEALKDAVQTTLLHSKNDLVSHMTLMESGLSKRLEGIRDDASGLDRRMRTMRKLLIAALCLGALGLAAGCVSLGIIWMG